MRGELIPVWSATWTEIWQELGDHESAPHDLYCELYRELNEAFKNKRTIEILADIIDDPMASREAFLASRSDDFIGEHELVVFMESVWSILDDLGGDALANCYFNLLGKFIEKYSLRYDLRRPCTLCPTLPGVFANLIRDLKSITGRDPHLDGLMKDFEATIRDLRTDHADGRIKTCFQKQMNLMEALGRSCPGVTTATLGAICNELGVWPHDSVRDALKNLYKFSCDYPGIRHGGTPTSANRMIDMRDMVAVTILLAGYTPYLVDRLDPVSVYGVK